MAEARPIKARPWKRSEVSKVKLWSVASSDCWWSKGCSRAEQPRGFLLSATLYVNDFMKTACDLINWMKEGLVHIPQWKCRARIALVLIHSKRRTIQSRLSQDRMPQNSEQLTASWQNETKRYSSWNNYWQFLSPHNVTQETAASTLAFKLAYIWLPQ